MWRALGDAGTVGGTKARQSHIGAARAKAWALASNGGGRAVQGEGQNLGILSRGVVVMGVTERTGRRVGETLKTGIAAIGPIGEGSRSGDTKVRGGGIGETSEGREQGLGTHGEGSEGRETEVRDVEKKRDYWGYRTSS